MPGTKSELIHLLCITVRIAFGDVNSKRKQYQRQLDIVIDVAGGHGGLASLFLICTSAFKAVVLDTANVGGGGVLRAWETEFIGQDKQLVYRNECLRAGLPHELEKALATTTADRVLEVACHACQPFSEEILNISCEYGVHVAVMPQQGSISWIVLEIYKQKFINSSVACHGFAAMLQNHGFELL
jgi:hypothetical protein